MEEPKLKIGDTVKIGRTVYTIMAEFEDTYNVSYKKNPLLSICMLAGGQ